MRYWLVKHDKESIKSRPGSIWREIEGCSRVPPNYRQVKIGDQFILYAYKTSEHMDSEPCQEIYGFYEVTREFEEEDLEEGRHWTIKGNPLPEHKQGWVPIQDLTQFFEKKKFNQQAVIELTRVEFERFLRRHEESLP
ncbi:MAG TPA: EVE domain-containing protein [Candidatus Dormibacteraeota bacterium]|nr:EVE domain-containing protein [Candidatus Dormibacteraeota bacterium]